MATRSTLTTFQDLLDALRDYFGGNVDAAAQPKLERACVEGLREVAHAHDWKCLLDRGRINLQTPYSTGTVTFDLTGGAHERMLTLSGGTWPTWAYLGDVRINDRTYDVEDRKSDTVVTLTAASAPSADLSSSSYTLFRDTYPLPNDFVRMHQTSLENLGDTDYTTAGEALLRSRSLTLSSGSPSSHTILRDPSLVGELAVRFHPPPTVAETVDFIYRRRPRPLYHTGYRTSNDRGTITLTTSSTTVTGSGTSFDSSMVGSVLRIGTSTTRAPASRFGAGESFVDERIVMSVASSTSLTIDNVPSQNFSGVKYVISDPVDVDPLLINLVHRACEKQAAGMMRTADQAVAEQRYMSALIATMGADRRYSAPSVLGEGPRRRWRMSDYPAGEDV